MPDRKTLELIVSSPASTGLERTEAQAALTRLDGGGSSLSGQDRVDREIESWVSARKLTSSELAEMFKSFAPATRTVIDDFGNAMLCGPPAPGAVERLTALIANTKSAVVRARTEKALRGTRHYIENARAIEARINAVPEELR